MGVTLGEPSDRQRRRRGGSDLREILSRVPIPRPRSAALTAALALVLLAAAAGTLLAANSLSLNPSNARRDNGAGTQTIVRASGTFEGFGDLLAGITVYWDVHDASHEVAATNVSMLQVGSDETFTFDQTVPLTLASVPVRPGIHTVIVCGDRSSVACVTSVSDTFTIPSPTISLSNSSGRQGGSFTLHGVGFSPEAVKEKVRVVWDPGGPTNAALYEDYPGGSTFDLFLTAPNVAAGTYTIRVCNLPVASTTTPQCVAADTATTKFTIQSPVVALSRTSGLAGQSF